MDTKEKISTLISVGAGLPPVNPYLDDSAQSDDEDHTAGSKRKAGRTPTNGSKPTTPKTNVAPDPKEYIAELERPEEEDLY